jgi:hypothetical protein
LVGERFRANGFELGDVTGLIENKTLWHHRRMAEPHNTIINRVARGTLGHLGLWRKGQSRFWHDDYAWRAFFVDFQHSSWSKGTYCNVGASWLWDSDLGPGIWPFHVSERVGVLRGQFVSFDRDPSGFENLVQQMAADAAREVVRLRGQFNDLAAVAAYYKDEPASYHGAVALGLTGHLKEAVARLNAVATESAGSEIEWERRLSATAGSLAQLLSDPNTFAKAIEDRIARTREGHRLRAIEHPLSSDGPILRDAAVREIDLRVRPRPRPKR